MRLAFATIIFLVSTLTGLAQSKSDLWLRVLTEEQSIIDVNRMSLVLEPARVFTAQFRTTHSKPEAVPGKPGLRYKTRIDSVQFDVKRWRYRVSESNLQDASGKIVLSYSSADHDGWKPLVGRTATRFFKAVSQLRPFGTWRVVSYRYASGELAAVDDPREIKSLVGSNIRLNVDRIVAANETCSAPAFNAITVTKEEFVKRVGTSLESLGLRSDKLETILLSCEARENFPSQTIMLRLSANKALMLWDGVFLELERPGYLFIP